MESKRGFYELIISASLEMGTATSVDHSLWFSGLIELMVHSASLRAAHRSASSCLLRAKKYLPGW